MSRVGHSHLPLDGMSRAASAQWALQEEGGEKASVSVREPHQQFAANLTRSTHFPMIFNCFLNY